MNEKWSIPAAMALILILFLSGTALAVKKFTEQGNVTPSPIPAPSPDVTPIPVLRTDWTVKWRPNYDETNPKSLSGIACVAGLELSKFIEESTSFKSQGYNFVPVDLTRGTQTFDLIVSNKYKIVDKYVFGKVTVKVDEDAVEKYIVTVSLTPHGNGGSSGPQFLSFFHDLISLESEMKLENVEPGENLDKYSKFDFDKKIRCNSDLDGDTSLLLYIHNHVWYSNRYQDPKTGEYRYRYKFDRNNSNFAQIQREMEELMKEKGFYGEE